MINSPTTKPLYQSPISSYRPATMNWRERGVGIVRIIFGLVYVVAATLKWQPQFQNTFVDWDDWASWLLVPLGVAGSR